MLILRLLCPGKKEFSCRDAEIDELRLKRISFSKTQHNRNLLAAEIQEGREWNTTQRTQSLQFHKNIEDKCCRELQSNPGEPVIISDQI